jgi:hypothetical protein
VTVRYTAFYTRIPNLLPSTHPALTRPTPLPSSSLQRMGPEGTFGARRRRTQMAGPCGARP